jgi:VRR-NUC domain
MTRIVKLKKVLTEDQEQIKLATWMTMQGIRFYAIPNGGSRKNWLEGLKFKRSGVQPGVPDICLPIPSGGYHGAYIELKRSKGGKVSELQSNWLAFLTEKGYYAQVANGFEEAREMILYYLGLTKPAA